MADSRSHALEKRARETWPKAPGSFAQVPPQKTEIWKVKWSDDACRSNQLLLWLQLAAAPMVGPLRVQRGVLQYSSSHNKGTKSPMRVGADSESLEIFSGSTTQLVIPGYNALKKRKMKRYTAALGWVRECYKVLRNSVTPPRRLA